MSIYLMQFNAMITLNPGLWNLLFAVVGLFSILGGLFAMMRGIYRTITRYVTFGILFAILIFAMEPITNAVGQIDISQFYKFSITVGSSTIPVTTIDKTLVQAIEASGFVQSTADASIDVLALQMAHSLLGLVLFLVGEILVVLIVGPLLGTIIYSLTFVIFLSADKRKNQKHSGISFVTGLICGTLVGVLFISPLTSIVNIASPIAASINKGEEEGTIDRNTVSAYQQYIDLLSAYSDSAFYSTMTFGSKDASKALDTNLMPTVTTVTTDSGKSSLLTELNTLVGLVPTVVGSLKNSSSGMTIDYDKLLQPTTISALLDKVANWKIIIGAMPALVTIATNYAGKSGLGDIGLDFSDVDWKGSIDDINSIYQKLYDAGLISQYAIPALNGGSVPSAFKLDYSKKEEYKDALATIGKNDIFAKNLPQVLCYVAKQAVKNSGLDYLSVRLDDYKLDFETDLSALVEFAFDAFRILGITEISSDTISNLSQDLLDKLKDTTFKDSVKALFVGGNISLPATADYEATTVTGYPGLLGLDLLSNKVVDIPTLVTSTLSSNSSISTYLSASAIKKLGDDLSSTSSLKSEMGYLLDVSGDIYDLSSNGMDISKGSDRTKVKNILDKVSDSVIINDVLPDILYSLLNTDSMSNMLYGLTADDFDFSPKDSEGKGILVSEMEKLLDIVGDAMTLSDALADTSKSTEEALKAIDTTLLKRVLNGLLTNKIINPSRRIEGGSTYSSEVNFNNLLKNLLNSDSIKQVGLITASDLSGVKWADYTVSGVTYEGEISIICNIVDLVADNSTLFLKSNLSINDIDPDFVQNIFTELGKSQLLKNTLPYILNKNVAPLIAQLGISVNFNNITDWEAEGQAFSEVIRKFQNLGTNVDINSINWESLNPNQVNALLTSLAQTGMLRVQKDDSGYYVDKFGELAYTMISKAGLSSDMIGDSVNKESFSTVSDKYTGTLKSSFKWYTASSLQKITYDMVNIDGNTVSVTSTIDTANEIYNIAQIFSAVQTVGISNITAGTATGANLKILLDALSASNCFKPAMASILSYAVGQLSDLTLSNGDTISFKTINSQAVLTLSDSDLTKEVNYLCDLYDMIKDDTFFNSITSGIDNLSDEAKVSLDNMLFYMASQTMMTSVKAGQSYSFLTEVMASLLHASTLDQMITKKSASEAKAAVKPYLADLTSTQWLGDYATSAGSNPDGTLAADFKSITSLKTDTTYTVTYNDGTSAHVVADVTGTYDAAADTVNNPSNTKTISSWCYTTFIQLTKEDRVNKLNRSKSEILRFTGILADVKAAGLTTANLTSPDQIGDADHLVTLLQDLNSSMVLHYAIPEFFNKIFTSMKISDYLTIGIVQYRSVDTDVHVEYTADNLAWWNHEIIALCNLYRNLRTYTTSLDIGSITLGGTLGGNTIKIGDFVEPLDQMYLLDDCKEYLIYHFMPTSVTDYLRSVASTSTNLVNYDKAYLVKSLLLPAGHTAAWLSEQCQILDAFIATSNSATSIDFSPGSTGTSSVANIAYSLMMSTFGLSYDSVTNVTTYTRCYFAQEVVSGILEAKMTALAGLFRNATFILPTDYTYFNIIEARGLEGIMKMANLSYGSTTEEHDTFKANLKAYFKIMGRTATGADAYTSSQATDYQTRNALLNQTEAKAVVKLSLYAKASDSTQALYNSRLAIILFTEYADKVEIKSGVTLANAITAWNTLYPTNKIDFEEKSFEENAQNVADAVDAAALAP
jgi:hypothetical protein